MVRHPPSSRPAKAGPAAHFDRNERYAYFGDRTLARTPHRSQGLSILPPFHPSIRQSPRSLPAIVCLIKTNQVGKTVVSIRKSQVYMPGVGGSHGFPALKSEGDASTNSF